MNKQNKMAENRNSFVDQLQKIWPILNESSKDDVAKVARGFLGDDYDEMCMRRMVVDDLRWPAINAQEMLNEIQGPDSAYESGHRYLRKESDCWTAQKMKFIVDEKYKGIGFVAKITKAYGQGEECFPLDEISSRLGLEGWHILRISGK